MQLLEGCDKGRKCQCMPCYVFRHFFINKTWPLLSFNSKLKGGSNNFIENVSVCSLKNCKILIEDTFY